MKIPSILCSVALAAASFLAAGCADLAQANAERQEPTYRTGSNIAQRQRVNQENGVQTMTGEEFQRSMHPQMPQPQPGGR